MGHSARLQLPTRKNSLNTYPHFLPQDHTLSTMRKFSIFSPLLQATSPTSLTASGKSPFNSWAIIPVCKVMKTNVRKHIGIPTDHSKNYRQSKKKIQNFSVVQKSSISGFFLHSTEKNQKPLEFSFLCSENKIVCKHILHSH